MSNRPHVWLVCAFCALGPIYWLPGIDPQYIRLFKTFLLAAIVVLIPYFIIVERNSLNKTGIALLIAIFATVLFSSIAMMYTDSIRVSLEYSSSYFYTLGFLTAAFLAVSTKNIESFRIPLIFTLSIYPIISSLIVLTNIGIIPDFRVPREFFVYRVLIDTRDTNLFFSGNGFGGSRTGWGPATAVSTLLLIATMGIRGTTRKFLAIGTALLTIFALYQIGARGAFLIFSIVFLLTYYRENAFRWGGFISCTLLGFALYSMYQMQSYSSRFRFNIDGLSFDQSMSLLTSNRYDTWVSGFRSFMESPVWGVGSQRSFLYRELEPHNAWLNIAAKSGLIGLIPGLIVLSILISLMNHESKAVRSCGYFGLPILAGILTAMIEPGFLFGAFFNATTFWLAVALQAPARSGVLKAPLHSSVRVGPNAI